MNKVNSPYLYISGNMDDFHCKHTFSPRYIFLNNIFSLASAIMMAISFSSLCDIIKIKIKIKVSQIEQVVYNISNKNYISHYKYKYKNLYVIRLMCSFLY